MGNRVMGAMVALIAATGLIGSATATAAGTNQTVTTGATRTTVPAAGATGRGHWTVQQAPSPEFYSEFNDVSCPSVNRCMTVGGQQTRKQDADQPNRLHALAERWNGHRWLVTTVPHAQKVGSTLYSVSCSSGSACTAVGTPGAERWNGRRWSLQSVPKGASLSAVACPTAHTCLAVGNGIWKWQSKKWSKQAPLPAKGDSLYSVSCTSATNCVAVGSTNNGVLAMQFNGTSWTPMATPDSTSGGAVLYSVSCSAAKACMAVGGPDLYNHNIAMRWNGTAWTLQHLPVPGAHNNMISGDDMDLRSVSCASAHFCTTIGDVEDNSGTPGAAPMYSVMHFNGQSWSTQVYPKFDKVPDLQAVSCASAKRCVAVGTHNTDNTIGDGSGSNAAKSLIEVWKP